MITRPITGILLLRDHPPIPISITYHRTFSPQGQSSGQHSSNSSITAVGAEQGNSIKAESPQGPDGSDPPDDGHEDKEKNERSKQTMDSSPGTVPPAEVTHDTDIRLKIRVNGDTQTTQFLQVRTSVKVCALIKLVDLTHSVPVFSHP